jgi:hypothetical protein
VGDARAGRARCVTWLGVACCACMAGRGWTWLWRPGQRPRVVGGGASRRGGWGAGSAPSKCGRDHHGLRCHGGCSAGVARWLAAELKLCAACSAPTFWVCSSPRLYRNRLPPSSRTRRRAPGESLEPTLLVPTTAAPWASFSRLGALSRSSFLVGVMGSLGESPSFGAAKRATAMVKSSPSWRCRFGGPALRLLHLHLLLPWLVDVRAAAPDGSCLYAEAAASGSHAKTAL